MNTKKPTAHLTINKSRLKQYRNNDMVNYFLNDTMEFQIELFNPTNQKVLAVVTIDNKSISNHSTGIVLRPAERVFLERYLDEAKKFVFKTYSVSGGEEVIKEATKYNGLVSVKFYNEDTGIVLGGLNDIFQSPPFCPPNGFNTFNGPNTRGGYDNNYGDGTYQTNNSGVATFNSTADFTLTNTDGFQLTSTISNSVDNLSYSAARTSTKTTESGQVEKGGKSDQEFSQSNDSFSSYPTETVTFKILPISSKPVEAKDLVRKYCDSCRSKVRAKANYCDKCGNKL